MDGKNLKILYGISMLFERSGRWMVWNTGGPLIPLQSMVSKFILALNGCDLWDIRVRDRRGLGDLEYREKYEYLHQILSLPLS
jgi:hypothetical protein